MSNRYHPDTDSERKTAPTPPPAPKAPYRPVLWAVLAVALLMLTTFVLFGASGPGLIKTSAASAPDASPSLRPFTT